MAGIWAKDPETPEGKYPIVLRRDGSVLDTPYIVLTLKDPCTEAALRAYASDAAVRGLDKAYVRDLRQLADECQSVRAIEGGGDPDEPRHREDSPMVIAWARSTRRVAKILI